MIRWAVRFCIYITIVDIQSSRIIEMNMSVVQILGCCGPAKRDEKSQKTASWGDQMVKKKVTHKKYGRHTILPSEPSQGSPDC